MLIFNVDFIKPISALPRLISFDEAVLNSSFIGGLIEVNSISQALCANAAGASFITAKKELLGKLSALAEYYLFDSKILAFGKNLSDLEQAAGLKVDAFALINPNSGYLDGEHLAL